MPTLKHIPFTLARKFAAARGCKKFRPLPLRERACTILQQQRMGEGVSPQEAYREEAPHPSYIVAPPSCPLPQGERATISHRRAAEQLESMPCAAARQT